ncbi:hypothetical protein Tco_0906213 [Tanacetum coccineum]
MDPMISLGQKNTLGEYMILSSADNRPPMLDKDLEEKRCLPTDIYSLVNHHRVAKDLWDRVQLLMQDKVNTKLLNSLPPKWSKFVTDVKLVKDLHTSNFDQLHAYLE